MIRDYNIQEINKSQISYFQERAENNKEWLDEMINKIEDMKNRISELT
tara:strand:+ start:315 stop:458 length:144 start_codon:yes stop_codon:yes gene_type:complete